MNMRREQRTLRLPPEVDQAIRRVAESTGEAQAVVVRSLLREALVNRGVVQVDAAPFAGKVRA